MFCAGRIPDDDLQRILASCGGLVLTTVSNINSAVLGNCEEFKETQVGNERFLFVLKFFRHFFRFNFFVGGKKAKASTILLRGGAEQFIAETERSLHDAIMIVRRAKKNDYIVAGENFYFKIN